MEAKEFVIKLTEWAEQDKENRAILCLTAEIDEGEECVTRVDSIAGKGEILVSMIKSVIEEDNSLILLFKRALTEIALEKSIKEILKVNK